MGVGLGDLKRNELMLWAIQNWFLKINAKFGLNQAVSENFAQL